MRGEGYEMADRKVAKAASFYNRAFEADDLQQRLLCLYDGFVSLYGPIDACRKAAELAGLQKAVLEKLLDSCMYDGDSDPSPDEVHERVLPTEAQVEALAKALGGLTSDCR